MFLLTQSTLSLARPLHSFAGLRPPHSLASLEDAFMQKVLQPQVTHAAFTLNPHRETEAVERIVNRRASAEQDHNEVPDEGLVAEPSTHELDLALDIILESAQGKDAALALWMTHRPPKWFRRMHSVHHSWGALYTVIVILHCAFTFVEAPMGRGFAWGGGADAYLIVAVGAMFFIFHYAECVMCFITAIMTTNRKLLSDTGEWERCEGNNARDFLYFVAILRPLIPVSPTPLRHPPPTTHHPQHHHVRAHPVWVFALITVMWIEWCYFAAGTHGGNVQEVATRQSIRRACVSVFDGQNHTAPWASNVDECVMFCTSILPRPVTTSLAPGATVAALSGCAERALSEVRNGTVLKHLKHIPSQQSQLVNGVLLLLPVTAILRPVVVLMKITSIRRALAHFVGTLKAATSTFILFSFIVLIATVQATLLFYNRGMDMDNLLTTYVLQCYVVARFVQYSFHTCAPPRARSPYTLRAFTLGSHLCLKVLGPKHVLANIITCVAPLLRNPLFFSPHMCIASLLSPPTVSSTFSFSCAG